MNQQLVVSKEIIEYFQNHLPAYRKNDAIEMIEYIEQNYFVSDHNTNHFNLLIDKIEEIESERQKAEIKKIITNWIQEKKYFIKCEYVNGLAGEIKLARETRDKIFLQPLLLENEVKSLSEKYLELEIHSSQTFINPLPKHKLKHLPTIIPLKKGEIYDLVKIISPFLRSTINVRVEDPYLPNYLARHNILKVIKNFPKVTFSIVFMSKDLFADHKDEQKKKKKEKQYDSFVEELDELNKKGYKISYQEKFESKLHRERFIFTRDFQIYIPGGFDFLKLDGTLAIDDEGVSEKREIRIEKRKFDVKFN